MSDASDRPSVLYKYRALHPQASRKITLDALTRNEVYFSRPSDFNDPFEGQCSISLTGQDRGRWTALEEYDDFELIEAHRERSREALRVFCLSERKDSLMMWSHYSNSHRGICLGFDASSEGEWFGLASPVRYLDRLPRIEFEQDSDRGSVYYASALSKSSDWSYEKEWRVADYQPRALRAYPGELLLEVLLGCEMSEHDRLEVLAWLDLRRTAVEVWQARRKANEFGLHFDHVGKAGGRRSAILDLT